jgi:hypothetical protein
VSLLAQYDLPPMAGFYFRMDNLGRVVVPAGDMSIQTFAVEEGVDGPTWRPVERRDVSSAVPEDQRGPMTSSHLAITPIPGPMCLSTDWTMFQTKSVSSAKYLY